MLAVPLPVNRFELSHLFAKEKPSSAAEDVAETAVLMASRI